MKDRCEIEDADAWVVVPHALSSRKDGPVGLGWRTRYSPLVLELGPDGRTGMHPRGWVEKQVVNLDTVRETNRAMWLGKFVILDVGTGGCDEVVGAGPVDFSGWTFLSKRPGGCFCQVPPLGRVQPWRSI